MLLCLVEAPEEPKQLHVDRTLWDSVLRELLSHKVVAFLH